MVVREACPVADSPPLSDSDSESAADDIGKAKVGIESLPFELLEEISAFACTDGGYTGCSLSLVNKCFHETSNDARFNTIALRSGTASQISQFLAAYLAARGHMASGSDSQQTVHTARRLRHLFISSPGDDDPTDDDSGHRSGSPLTRPPLLPPSLLERLEFLRSVFALLKAVAPGLETLVLAQSPDSASSLLAKMPFSLPEAADVRFPLLRELTVVGSAVVFPKPEIVPTGTAPHQAQGQNHTGPPLGRRAGSLRGAAQYPRLTRLHLVGTTMRLAQWAARVPRLTHLRVFGKDHVRAFAHELKEVVRGHGPPPARAADSSDGGRDRETGAGARPLFPFLRHLIVQPYRTVAPASPTGRLALGDSTLVVKSVQLVFKELLEDNTGNPSVCIRPTINVETAHEMESVVLEEWVEGGFICWKGDSGAELAAFARDWCFREEEERS
ncbi:hypothetical protein C8Q80DRAFT_1276132 [Daedaleopsis nitida]|nr:hypothetical protein C8Q80DRAFT_1276132 [Daedaleopsis nitida]